MAELRVCLYALLTLCTSTTAIDTGAYTDTGATNCCRDPLTKKAEPGSYGNEELDVQTFADWGVDQVCVADAICVTCTLLSF